MREFTFSAVFVLLMSTPLAAQTALDELEKRLEGPALPAEIPATRNPGYLGMFADNVPRGRPGVQITSVTEGGPADRSGLTTGDRIIAIDQRVISSTDDFATLLEEKFAGDTVVLEVVRNGQRFAIEVTLAERPAHTASKPAGEKTDTALLPEPIPAEASRPSGRPILGVQVSTITQQARYRYGLTVRQGALVENVLDGSPAERAGLTAGAVIVAVDGQRVDTPADLMAHVRGGRPGQELELAFFRGHQFYRRSIPLQGDNTDPEMANGSTSSQPPRLGAMAEELPRLRRIENFIDRFVPPAVDRTTGGEEREIVALKEREIVALKEREIVALQRQIEVLRSQVEVLQRRLNELESRAPGVHRKSDR